MATKTSWRFGKFRKEFSIHLKHFRGLQQRCRQSNHGVSPCETDLSDDVLGLLQFIEEIGPIPVMHLGERLSVGRKKHELGYVKGNYFWQSLSDNSRESAFRIRPHKYVTTEGNKLRGDKLRGIARSVEVRAKISKSQKGRVFTAEHRQKLSVAAKNRCAR